MTFARDLANFADVSAQNLTLRNAIINGSMQVAQRGTSFTSTSSANNDDVYTLDRWTLLSDGNDAVDVTQATDAPTGLKYSCGLDVETANKKFGIIQFIENQNIAHLTSKTVTLSFYAKTTGSSISDVKAVVLAWTGTANTVTSDVVSSWNASGTVPTFVASWTAENTATNLSVTSSWARYSVSAALDTSSTNNIAVFIWCDDATTTVSDFLYVSGVQLEVGSSASTFELLPIGAELGLCQRYYQKSYNIDVVPGTSTLVGALGMAIFEPGGNFDQLSVYASLKPTMRGTPTVTAYATDGTINRMSNSLSTVNNSGGAANTALIGANGFVIYNTAGNDQNNIIAHYTASAEL
jgi:hypothetical protein